MPPQLARLAGAQHGLLLLSQCHDAGIDSDEVRRRLRRREWRGVRTGVVATGPKPANRLAALVERALAALLVLPTGSLICERTATALWRLTECPPEDEPIHVLLPAGTRQHRMKGIRMHAGAPAAMQIVGGVPCTDMARTVIDCCARLPLGDAVALLDAGERVEPGFLETCRSEARRRSGRGCRGIRDALRLATGRPESALESIAWVLWHAGGLPVPLLQAVIRRGGRFLARVDFLWPEAMLVVEVDGLGKYSEPGELQREKLRQNALVAAGYVVLRFTWADVVHRPDVVLRQLKAALMINT